MSREIPTVTISRGPGPGPIGVVIRPVNCRARPQTFRLTSGTCTIGSGSDCSLVLDEPGVSRVHVELSLLPEGVQVVDCGSRNGTFYMDQRIEKMVLSLGSRLQLANTQLIIEPDLTDLNAAGAAATDGFRGMVGRSMSMRRIFTMLRQLDGSLANVLVVGESGVGKELVARALHEGSHVADGPYVALNCGAIPRDLVASELFGHRRGAFTGAVEARKGAFARADGGTLFLDEIGELPLDAQPMLLRTLETGEVTPLGSDETKTLKVRLVAATHRDLPTLVAEGKFREDLYYRIAVITIPIPPLRERPDDIEMLALHLARQEGLSSLTPDVVGALRERSWPGNVRELRNCIQAYAVFGALPEGRKTAGLLEAALRSFIDLEKPYQQLKEDLNDAFVRVYLRDLLAATRGNQTQAAKISGLERAYISRLLGRLGLRAGTDGGDDGT